MFDPKELSYPRVEDGVVLYGPEDWPKAKLDALRRAEAKDEPEDEPEDDGVLNLNTATADQLKDVLPRVGDALAQTIIDARPFENVDQLAEIKGISQDTVDDLRDRLTV